MEAAVEGEHRTSGKGHPDAQRPEHFRQYIQGADNLSGTLSRWF